MQRISRRNLILAAAAGTGGLLLTVPVLRHFRGADPEARPLGGEAWLRVAEDGVITAFSTVAEMGQGAVSGLLQALADELDADWKDMRFELVDVDDAFMGRFGYYTAGSNSIRRRLPVYRELGARARAMLVTAAARNWGVPREECSTSSGLVLHAPSGRSARYGALAPAAARESVPAQVQLKTPDQWRLMGRGLRRLDTPAKVDGSARFGIDVEVPGMLIAAIRHCPVQGGRLKQVEAQPALGMAGVHKVVPLDDAVAVVADGYWRATRALEVLAPEWEIDSFLQQSSSDLSTLADAELDRLLQAVPLPGTPESSAVQAVYDVPMLAHAPLEPMNATADVGGGSAEIWVPSQVPDGCRAAVAAALGMKPGHVTVHRTLIGGGFGRRLTHDYAVEAALVSQAAGVPVKLIWSREEDFLRTTVRPAAKARMHALLDQQGGLAVLRMDSVTVGHGRESSSLEVPPYRAGRFIAHTGRVDSGVRVGAWRSVDASFDVFFLESFVDECAARAGKDPLEYRLQLLEPDSRGRRILTELQRMCDYVPGSERSRAVGIACFSGLGSHVAVAVELAQQATADDIRIRTIHCAVDCGMAVNPDLIRSQIEGGALFALSATLAERITIRQGQIEQRNFGQYPVLAIGGAPVIEVRILDDPLREPGGVGELAGPPVAPALANALFRQTGVRHRSLPLGSRA